MFLRTSVATIAMAVWVTFAGASQHATPGLLPEGPAGNIDMLSEDQFYVDGSASSAKVFTFANGSRSLHFIPMIHQAEPAFYEAVASQVKHLKAHGMDLFYEFIDFDDATLEDKRRARAMLGFLPSPTFYAENASDGLVAQDNAQFLGFPGGKDVNVDLTVAELADAYEALTGPLEISEENLTTPIREFVMPTAVSTQITRGTIDWRNQHLAEAINSSSGSVVVLDGADHSAGTVQWLQALDPSWRRMD